MLAALVASGRTHLSPPFPLFTALGDATHPLCLLLIGPTRSTDLLLLQKEQKFAWYRLICLTARACHFCWGTGQGIFQNKTLNEEQFSLCPLKAVALKLSPPNSNPISSSHHHCRPASPPPSRNPLYRLLSAVQVSKAVPLKSPHLLSSIHNKVKHMENQEGHCQKHNKDLSVMKQLVESPALSPKPYICHMRAYLGDVCSIRLSIWPQY